MNNKTQTLEITSTQNSLIKYIVKLQNPKFRKSEKLILIDGEKSLIDIIQRKMEFVYLFIKKGDKRFIDAKIQNLVYVNDEILKKISTTTSAIDAVGIIKEPKIQKDIELEKLKKEHNIEIDKKKVELKETIKVLGITNVKIRLYEGIYGNLKVDIIPK